MSRSLAASRGARLGRKLTATALRVLGVRESNTEPGSPAGRPHCCRSLCFTVALSEHRCTKRVPAAVRARSSCSS